MQSILANKVLEKIRSGKTAIGAQLRSRSPLIAEMMGFLGLDYVFIESEHFLNNEETLENSIRAVQLGDAVPFVRIPSHDGHMISHIIDGGAMGVILPHLETAEDTKALVDAIKFPPLGKRGAGYSSRAGHYGLISIEKQLECLNRNVMAMGMIESVKGVENIEEILKAGLDMIIIGFSDLALDIGKPGQNSCAEVWEQVDRVVACAERFGVPVGAKVKDAEEAAFYRSKGFSFFSLGSEMDIFKGAVTAKLAAVQEALGQ